jgi:hypothetical protein
VFTLHIRKDEDRLRNRDRLVNRMRYDGKKYRILDPGSILLVLLTFLLFRGLLYVFFIPPWQNSYEPTHFEQVRFIAEERTLPAAGTVALSLRREIAASMIRHGYWESGSTPVIDDDILASIDHSLLGMSTFTQPRLYYIITAVWLWPWLNLPIEGQLYIVRMFSLLLDLLVALAAYNTFRLLYPYQKWLALAATAFVIFQPMHTALMTAVNNDALINALSALFFLIMAWIFQGGISMRKVSFLLIVLILGLLTKVTAVILLMSLPFALLFYLWRTGRRRIFLGLLLIGCFLAALVILVSQRDMLPEWRSLIGELLGGYPGSASTGVLGNSPDTPYSQRPLEAAWIVFQCFWGAFGSRGIGLSSGLYIVLCIVCFVAFCGLINLSIRWLRRRGLYPGTCPPQPYLAFGFSAFFLAAMLAVIRSMAFQDLSLHITQAGSIFLTMVPLSLIVTLGLRAWAPWHWRRSAGFVYILILFAFDALCFWGFMMPTYY